MSGMTNDECGMPNELPRTALKAGRYPVIVNGPAGCVLSVVMEMANRSALDALADVDYLEETLVALSVASAAVMAEMERRRKA